MSAIGSTLKEARAKKEITLEDVHAKLKIHPRVLQLLEEEKFEKLPSPLFAKSFLRSYAQFLELDSEALIDSYEKEKKLPEPEQKLYLKPTNMSPAPKIPASWWTIGGCAALIVVIFASGIPSKTVGVWSEKIRQAQAQRKTEKAKFPKKTAPVKAAEEAEEAPPAASWLNSPKMGNFPKLNKKTPLSLEIRAIEPVWVHITSDGKVVYQGVIKKGAAQASQAKESIEIWTGNASSMSLFLNKTGLGSPGKGVVKKMVISHEGIRIAPAAEA
jgi:cytoskeletal protein RodZ